jgi:hypothetical protein
MDRSPKSLFQTGLVITSPAKPGVVIQPFDKLTALSESDGLDGQGAERLAMTGHGAARTAATLSS